ncbi:MAG: hypothetical protein IJS89_08595 [Bacteroidaceae bacterium]|nr:hypothetical protein [Bacteroidaceae bacterium]
MKRVVRLSVLLWLMFLLVGCTDDSVQNAYSNVPARFTFRTCATVPQMKAALGGMPGAFFIVRRNNENKYIITSNEALSNPYTYFPDALDLKLSYICLSGFVIGTPVYGKGLEAYDLACPNCYLGFVSRPLQFESTTRLACPKCHCAYSLDNPQAILVEGVSKATVLHRYHVDYDGLNNLSVYN